MSDPADKPPAHPLHACKDGTCGALACGVVHASYPIAEPPAHPLPWRWVPQDVGGGPGRDGWRFVDANGATLIGDNEDFYGLQVDAEVRAVTERAGAMEALLRRLSRYVLSSASKECPFCETSSHESREDAAGNLVPAKHADWCTLGALLAEING